MPPTLEILGILQEYHLSLVCILMWTRSWNSENIENSSKTYRKHPKLTDSADPEEEASVAEIVFGRFELSRSTKRRQLLANRTAVGKSVARKVLQNSKWFEQNSN